MIPYDLDPSLHSSRPNEPVLDDGFSHPGAEHLQRSLRDYGASDADTQLPNGQPALSDKSDF